MYTNKQRLEWANLMKDVTHPVSGRKGINNWTPISLTNQSPSSDLSSESIQIYSNGENVAIAIQDAEIFDGTDELVQQDSYNSEDFGALFGLLRGDFNNQYETYLQLIKEQISELNLDPSKITFVGAGLGGAHAQVLAETFGSNLFTYDAPGVKSILDEKGILLSQTYPEILKELTLSRQGVLNAQNIVEDGSFLSAGNKFFDDKDYIGSVTHQDSVSNLLPFLTNVLQKPLDSLLELEHDQIGSKKKKADSDDKNIKIGIKDVAKTAVKAPRIGVTAALTGLSAVPLVYDSVRDGGNHDLDVYIDYISDMTRSSEQMETLMSSVFEAMGGTLNSQAEQILSQIAQEVSQKAEAAEFYDFQEMVDFASQRMSEELSDSNPNMNAYPVQAINSAIKIANTPVHYVLSKLDDFVDSNEQLNRIVDVVFGDDTKFAIESDVMIRELDHFLRRELSTSLPNVNEMLNDFAGSLIKAGEFAVDSGQIAADFAARSVNDLSEFADDTVDELIDAGKQVYDSFENHLKEKLQEQNNKTNMNDPQLPAKLENIEVLLAQLQGQMQILTEMQNTILENSEMIVSPTQTETIQNNVYQSVEQMMRVWSDISTQLNEHQSTVSQVSDVTVRFQGVMNATENNLSQISVEVSFCLCEQNSHTQSEKFEDKMRHLISERAQLKSNMMDNGVEPKAMTFDATNSHIHLKHEQQQDSTSRSAPRP